MALHSHKCYIHLQRCIGKRTQKLQLCFFFQRHQIQDQNLDRTDILVLDKVLMAGMTKMQVKIVSRRHEQINALISQRLDCGTSLLHMETGYLHREQDMVLAVISKRDLPRLNQLVLDEDPEAFMIINQINEVQGRGFTLKKVYK